MTFAGTLAGYGTTVAVLAGINALTTPFFPWFLFAAVADGEPGCARLDWSFERGVTLKQVLKREGTPMVRGGRRKARPRLEYVSRKLCRQGRDAMFSPDHTEIQ